MYFPNDKTKPKLTGDFSSRGRIRLPGCLSQQRCVSIIEAFSLLQFGKRMFLRAHVLKALSDMTLAGNVETLLGATEDFMVIEGVALNGPMQINSFILPFPFSAMKQRL